MGLFHELRSDGAVGLFQHIAEAFSVQRAGQADRLTIAWLAGEIAERTELSVCDASTLLADVAASGGPDLRTPESWALAAAILGVPLAPTVH